MLAGISVMCHRFTARQLLNFMMASILNVIPGAESAKSFRRIQIIEVGRKEGMSRHSRSHLFTCLSPTAYSRAISQVFPPPRGTSFRSPVKPSDISLIPFSGSIMASIAGTLPRSEHLSLILLIGGLPAISAPGKLRPTYPAQPVYLMTSEHS